jgi:putative hydrolase of the HAD superfamily
MRACRRFGERLGLSPPEFLERLRHRGFAELMRQFESGRMEPDAFAGAVMELAGLQLSYDEFVECWVDIFWLNEPIARLVARLKSRGYRLLLGSNTNVLHAAHFRRQFAPAIGLFDHLVLSYEVGCIKPERRFYEACVRAAGAPAESCVFVDDLHENVEGAREAGLKALHYVDTPTLLADLRRLGVEVLPDEG